MGPELKEAAVPTLAKIEKIVAKARLRGAFRLDFIGLNLREYAKYVRLGKRMRIKLNSRHSWITTCAAAGLFPKNRATGGFGNQPKLPKNSDLREQNAF